MSEPEHELDENGDCEHCRAGELIEVIRNYLFGSDRTQPDELVVSTELADAVLSSSWFARFASVFPELTQPENR